MFVWSLSSSYMRLASKKNDPSRVLVLPSKHITQGCHDDSSPCYNMNLSYGDLHMPTLCSHAVMRIIRLASSMACRKSLPATIGARLCGRRSTTPLPHIVHGILAFSFIATIRHGAPSRTWWYPVDMGGRTYVVGYSVTMSLIHPFAGLGADTARGGLYGGFRCMWVASLRMGGCFGCFAIITFSKFRMGGGFAETTACTCMESVPTA